MCTAQSRWICVSAWVTGLGLAALSAPLACTALKADEVWPDSGAFDAALEARKTDGRAVSDDAARASSNGLPLPPGADASVCDRPCATLGQFQCGERDTVELCASTGDCATWLVAGYCLDGSQCCKGICMTAEAAGACTSAASPEAAPEPDATTDSQPTRDADVLADAASTGKAAALADGNADRVFDAEAGATPASPLPDRNVVVSTLAGVRCAGTLLTDSWVISANDCVDYETDEKPNDVTVLYEGVRGLPSQKVVAKAIVRHPTNSLEINPDRVSIEGVNVVLLDIGAQLQPSGIRVPIFAGSTSELHGQTVTCVGGPLEGSLKDSSSPSDVATLDVTKVSISDIGFGKVHVGDRVWYTSETNVEWRGQPGGGCYVQRRGAPQVWELALVQSMSNKVPPAEGVGTSLAHETVRAWLDDNIPAK